MLVLSDNFRKMEATNARVQMAAASPADPKGLPPEDPQALYDQAVTLRLEGKYPEARALL